MLNIIIGHRGTGKTSWLSLLRSFYKKWPACFFDLDEEIEKRTGQSVKDLFEQGEASFRQTEKKVFKSLIHSIPKNKTCFLSVGAGFVFEKNPSWNVIYLCRYSDEEGRIFLNRPQLTSFQNPFVEYKNFYKKRNSYYYKQADEQFFRREHFKQLEPSDLLFVGLKKLSYPCFTFRLDPRNVPKSEKQLQLFLQKRLNWGLRFFELNDQTADEGFAQTIRNFVSEDKILFSSQISKNFSFIENKQNWSWDLSLGEPPQGVTILALHDRGKKELKIILKEFSCYKNYHLKLAIEIFNLKELKTAYDWQCEDPENRSFLPRSQEGRWLWFRQAFGPKMFLHFIKERALHFKRREKGSFEVLDQPFLSEAVPFIKPWEALAGILGDPVQLSATPAEQNDFFYRQMAVPVLSLPLKEQDMTEENLKILRDLGFIFFAVTSPLKEKAFLFSDTCDKISQEFKTANTLIFHNKIWKAFNTDWNGLQELSSYSSKDTSVWGGGGIRPVLKKCLPLARFYSARTGKLLTDEGPVQAAESLMESPVSHCLMEKVEDNGRARSSASIKQQTFSQTKGPFPKTLIWAVGRKRIEQGCLMPPKDWKPSQVIDINYTEDSPGLEYALQVQANYQNGFGFFKEQAKKQREVFLQITGKYTDPV